MNKLQEDVPLPAAPDTTPRIIPKVIQDYDKKKKKN
jgi:hypothetical protein